MTDKLKSNIDLFDGSYLSTNDILIKPTIGCLSSRKDADMDASFIYNSPMDTVVSENLFDQMEETKQNIVSCRFNSELNRIEELKFYRDYENYWFTVGSSSNDFLMLRSWALLQEDIPKINICVDVAHGATVKLIKLYKRYRGEPWCNKLMSGTVATPDTAHAAYNGGCTHIRVGIGPGSACSTRIVTGCGVPNISAVFNIWMSFDGLQSKEPPVIIADGGIKNTADIAKYLSAGADAVMLGNLLSRTYESGGWTRNRFFSWLFRITKKQKWYRRSLFKRYRGQASAQFQVDKLGVVRNTPEGVQGPVQNPEYHYKDFFNKTVGGLRSTLSYVGLKKLVDLGPENVELIKITQSGYLESRPHLLD